MHFLLHITSVFVFIYSTTQPQLSHSYTYQRITSVTFDIYLLVYASIHNINKSKSFLNEDEQLHIQLNTFAIYFINPLIQLLILII